MAKGIKVIFRREYQFGTNEKDRVELYSTGFVPAIPQVGTIVYINKLNTYFMVNGVLMASMDEGKKGGIELFEVNPAIKTLTRKEIDELKIDWSTSGWMVCTVHESTKRVLEAMRLINTVKD